MEAQSTDLWIARKSNGDEVARVDSSGNMYIKGILYEGESCPMSPSNEVFQVKNVSDGAVAYMDESGNLKLTGAALVWEGGQ